jgi:hypothetical protein
MLGAERITALTDASNTARLCNALYAYVRNSVLTDYPWSFAQKRVALATVAGTPVFTDDMVTIIYQLPTDFLQLNYVSQMGALVRIESDKLLSDTASLKIKYTYELTDTSKFKAKFVEALAARLAAELAVPITSKRTLAESLFTIYYDKKLPQAISLDSQQETPKDPVQNEWLDARKIGTSEISGPAGWSTWYPPNWW